MRRQAFTIAIASLLAGCGAAPDVYEVPLGEALARLQKADTDGFRMARQCGILIHLDQNATKDNAVTWRITSSGSEVLRFTVALTAEGDGTRAAIEVPPDPEGGEMYDGEKFYPRPAVNQPLRPALKELVDAAMAQRPFNGQGLGNNDDVCNVQRSGLESGSFRFGVDDVPGMDSRQSDRFRQEQESRGDQDSFDENFGAPMDSGAGDGEFY